MLLHYYQFKTEFEAKDLMSRIITKLDQLSAPIEFKTTWLHTLYETHRISHFFFNCLPPSERSIIDLHFTLVIMKPSIKTFSKLRTVLDFCFNNSTLLKTHKRWIKDGNKPFSPPIQKKRYRLSESSCNRIQSEPKTNSKHWEVVSFCMKYGRDKTKNLSWVTIKNPNHKQSLERLNKYDLKFIKKPPIKSQYGFIYLPIYRTHAYNYSEWLDINEIMEHYNRRNNKPIHNIHKEAKSIKTSLKTIKLQHIENSIRYILKFWNNPMDIEKSIDQINNLIDNQSLSPLGA